MIKRALLLGGAAVVSFMLSACATNPYKGDSKTQSDALLKQQFDLADSKGNARSSGRIIFAGFAMHSQSKAFRNDVITVERSLQSIDPNAIVFKLNNPAFGQSSDWPFATTENIAEVLRKVSAMARPQDKVVVLFSTHGNPNVLTVNISNQYHPHVSPGVLNQWLADLRGKPTVLLLSACFSGSFLQPLSGPSRVILTAAAHNRSSFGCQFHSANTYFIDALFNKSDLRDQTLVDLMEQAKVSIDKTERDQKLSPPSLPQMFVGATALSWARRPIKEWARP
jgi:Peptidase C13 family